MRTVLVVLQVLFCYMFFFVVVVVARCRGKWGGGGGETKRGQYRGKI